MVHQWNFTWSGKGDKGLRNGISLFHHSLLEGVLTKILIADEEILTRITPPEMSSMENGYGNSKKMNSSTG